jgi:GTP-binding protein
MIKVAIVGRPNVGKSTLFNRLIGRKKAIIHKMPGTTRDRNDYEVKWKDKKFIVTDTAGWSSAEDVFSKDMARQLNEAVRQADIVLFTVDAKTGVNPLDSQIAQQIRLQKKKTILVANKIDSQAEEAKGYEFYELGFSDVVFVSASHGRGINDLLDKIWSGIKYDRKDKAKKEIIKVAIVGKPNVGKSSLINAAVKEERSIVCQKAGTTRDSLEVPVNIDGKDYILIDTAGLHRGNKPSDDMQYLSTLSASYAIDDCDVAVLIIDASCGIGETEAKITSIIIDKGKALIFALNKWDLIDQKDEAVKYFSKDLRDKIKFAAWADILFVSAKTGQRLNKIFDEVQIVYKEYSKQIDEQELNETVRKAIDSKPFIRNGKKLSIKTWAQVSIKPPVFIFEVNDVELVHFSYQRYLENQLRRRFGFCGSPLFLKFRKYYKGK